jgi:hypothetical protein
MKILIVIIIQQTLTNGFEDNVIHKLKQSLINKVRKEGNINIPKTIENELTVKDYFYSDPKSREELTPVAKFIENPTSYCRSFHTCDECYRSLWFSCGWCHMYGCTYQAERLCYYAKSKKDIKDKNDLSALCSSIKHQGSIIVPAGMRQYYTREK